MSSLAPISQAQELTPPPPPPVVAGKHFWFWPLVIGNILFAFLFVVSTFVHVRSDLVDQDYFDRVDAVRAYAAKREWRQPHAGDAIAVLEKEILPEAKNQNQKVYAEFAIQSLRLISSEAARRKYAPR